MSSVIVFHRFTPETAYCSLMSHVSFVFCRTSSRSEAAAAAAAAALIVFTRPVLLLHFAALAFAGRKKTLSWTRKRRLATLFFFSLAPHLPSPEPPLNVFFFFFPSAAVTLKYFLSLLIFLCLQPHLPPFPFLIPATLHLCNLARSELCYFYTRAGRAERAERAGGRASGGGGVDFQVFLRAPSSNLAHLPPSAFL